MRKLSLTMVAAIAVVLVGIFPTASARAQEAPTGKEIFLAAKCDMCHSVPSQSITAKVTSEKMKGPNLAGVAADPAELAQFLRKQVERNGKMHQKEFKGTDDELKALVGWVLEQK